MDVPGVAESFHGELDVIAALHLKWHARLSGNIERELMNQPMDLEAAVATAWAVTSRQVPGIRRIIDRYTDAPLDADMGAALARARQKEWLKLAAAAGISSDEGPQSARAGERLLERARSLAEAPEAIPAAEPSATTDVDEVTSPSLVARIRAVLAA